MSSEPLRDDNGQPVHVGRTQTGALGINIRSGMTSVLGVFSGERLEKLLAAIDRETTQAPR